MSYARYKFNKAVQSLKEAGSRRREWLASYHLARLMRLTVADVPVDLRDEFQLFQSEMNSIMGPIDFDNPMWNATPTIDDATAARIIDRITHMHEVIEIDAEQNPPLNQD